MILGAIWGILLVLTAEIAYNKGINWVGAAIFSAFLPVIALVVILLMQDRVNPHKRY